LAAALWITEDDMGERSRGRYFETVACRPGRAGARPSAWTRLYVFDDPDGAREMIDHIRSERQAERLARALGCVRWRPSGGKRTA
jgi:hypothetical protein